MTTATTAIGNAGSARSLLRRAWAFSPLLTLAGLANLALIPLFLFAALVDPRVITGAPAWIKPLKFALSIALFCATFLWLLSFVQGRPRWVRLIAAVTGAGLLVETGLIAMQVVRGTTSHFNVSTPFDATVFSLMGGFITAVSICTLLLAIWLIRQHMPDPVFAWSLRLGVLISFVGMTVAFLMTTPTADQLAAAQTGAGMARAGAHSVGSVADGGPGLPLLGWSTVGGDLRVPPFVGLHAMQVLPLLGGLLALGWARQRWTVRGRLGLIWTASLGYLALVGLLTWQALRGQSIVAPDSLTVAAAALVFGALLAATALIIWREQTRHTTDHLLAEA